MGTRSAASATALLALALTAAACQAKHGETTADDPVVGRAMPSSESRSTIGDGFVVWESNRSGSWRLWLRGLDGSPPRQLTAEDGPRIHCCPHISPDGRQVAYLSLAADQQGYPRGGAVGELHLIRPDGTGDRFLLEARNYYENRAVVWRSEGELVFIDPEQRTCLLTLQSGEVEILAEAASQEYPWLIDSQLRFATSGRVCFAPYDRSRREVVERSPVGGCQPYFSQDGKWGFWVAAPGGPIHKIDLRTGDVGTLIKKSDPRLPGDFGYLYFPMLSADGRALAFAASRAEHPHFAADYEIFLVPTDPMTLELLAPPVRFTDHPATDRYPDLYLEPLELGLYRGEAPLTVRPIPPPESGSYRWSWGDGTPSDGEIAEHTFDRPGTYVVTASRDQLNLVGRVIVEAPSPPRIVSLEPTPSGDEVHVRFDEPVDADHATWSLQSGIRVRSVEPLEGHRELVLHLGRPLTTSDELTVEGIRDRSSRPNLMPTARLALDPASWPSNREGLILMWESGDATNLVLDEESGLEESVVLQAQGRARFDHHWALNPNGGLFTASEKLANRLRWSCQATNELSIEAIVEPQPSHRRPGVILGMARGASNFVLSQHGSDLWIAIRVKSRGPDAAPEVRLLELPAGRRSHVTITYSAGRLSGYLNGQQALSTQEIQGGFFHWQTLPLTIGADWRGRSPWQGSLEGLAIYNRVLPAEEVGDNAAHALRRLQARAEVPRWTLRARRRECSEVPSLQEIAPYREALVVCEYRILDVLEGDYDHSTARVVQWAIQDSERVVLSGLEEAGGDGLVVELFSDNPQLSSLYLAETLPARSDLPLLYLVGEPDRR